MLIKCDPWSPCTEDIRTISVHLHEHRFSGLIVGIRSCQSPASSPRKLTRLSGGLPASTCQNSAGTEPEGAVVSRPFSGGEAVVSDPGPFSANSGTCCQGLNIFFQENSLVLSLASRHWPIFLICVGVCVDHIYAFSGCELSLLAV